MIILEYQIYVEVGTEQSKRITLHGYYTVWYHHFNFIAIDHINQWYDKNNLILLRHCDVYYPPVTIRVFNYITRRPRISYYTPMISPKRIRVVWSYLPPLEKREDNSLRQLNEITMNYIYYLICTSEFVRKPRVNRNHVQQVEFILWLTLCSNLKTNQHYMHQTSECWLPIMH